MQKHTSSSFKQLFSKKSKKKGICLQEQSSALVNEQSELFTTKTNNATDANVSPVIQKTADIVSKSSSSDSDSWPLLLEDGDMVPNAASKPNTNKKNLFAEDNDDSGRASYHRKDSSKSEGRSHVVQLKSSMKKSSSENIVGKAKKLSRISSVRARSKSRKPKKNLFDEENKAEAKKNEGDDECGGLWGDDANRSSKAPKMILKDGMQVPNSVLQMAYGNEKSTSPKKISSDSNTNSVTDEKKKILSDTNVFVERISSVLPAEKLVNKGTTLFTEWVLSPARARTKSRMLPVTTSKQTSGSFISTSDQSARSLTEFKKSKVDSTKSLDSREIKRAERRERIKDIPSEIQIQDQETRHSPIPILTYFLDNISEIEDSEYMFQSPNTSVLGCGRGCGGFDYADSTVCSVENGMMYDDIADDDTSGLHTSARDDNVSRTDGEMRDGLYTAERDTIDEGSTWLDGLL